MRRSPATLALLTVGLVYGAQGALAADVYKWTDENGVAHYSDAPPEGQQYDKVDVRGKVEPVAAPVEPEAPAPAPAATSPRASNESNCEIARKNVGTFQSGVEISMDRDGDGKPEVLNPVERAAELARSQELVNFYCK